MIAEVWISSVHYKTNVCGFANWIKITDWLDCVLLIDLCTDLVEQPLYNYAYCSNCAEGFQGLLILPIR